MKISGYTGLSPTDLTRYIYNTMMAIRFYVCFLLGFCPILSLYAQNVVVSVFQAGACNNVFFTDAYIDSMCSKNHIPHLYYLKGIRRKELQQYAKTIFGREIDSRKVVTPEQEKQWQLHTLKPINVVVLIRDNSIIRIKPINQFEEKDLTTLSFGNIREPIFEGTKSYTLAVDSFTLQYHTKIKLDSRIRINQQCRYIKTDTLLYILEPLFDKKLYKLNASTGQILMEKPLEHLLNVDSILYYKYYTTMPEGHPYRDTIRKYTPMAKEEADPRFYDIFCSGSEVFLTGAYGILTFVNKADVMTLHYNTVYRFDQNLNLKNYYFDRYGNYSRYYPVIDYCIHCTRDLLQAQVIEDYNAALSVKRVIYYTLIDNTHNLFKTDKDTLLIPKSFTGRFYSNIVGRFVNLQSKNAPAWLLDPCPYIYYPHDTLYYDLVDDTLINHCENPKRGADDEPCVLNVVYTGSQTYAIIFVYGTKTIRVLYNIDQKKIVNRYIYPRLDRFNLKILSDEKGQVFMVPAEEGDADNYIYYE